MSASVCCSSNADTSIPQFTLDFSLSCWIAFKSLSVTSKWLMNLLFYVFSIRFPSLNNWPSSLSHSAILAIMLSQCFDCITKYGCTVFYRLLFSLHFFCILPPSLEINTFFVTFKVFLFAFPFSFCLFVKTLTIHKSHRLWTRTYISFYCFDFTESLFIQYKLENSALKHCWTPFSLD